MVIWNYKEVKEGENMIRKKKTRRNNSAFCRELSGLARKFQKLNSTDFRQAAGVRKKIYDLLTDAVLKRKPKQLKAAEIEEIIDFMREDTVIEDNDEFARAIALLEELHKSGSIAATAVLADIFSAYTTEPPVIYRKRSRALLMYEQVSKAKDPVYAGYGHCRLAELHAYFSQADEIDGGKYSVLAKRHIETSAYELESPFGMVMLGYWHSEGSGVDKDWKKSHDLFKQAYSIVKDPVWDGCWIKAEAYFRYGNAMYFGQGCSTEGQRGVRLVREAAALGNRNAAEWLKDNKEDAGGNAASAASGAEATKGENPMAPFAAKKKKPKIKNKKELEKLLQPLDDMIGCAPVKREIESLVYLSHANALRLQKKLPVVPPSLHAAFLGAPGTGKTTVARLYGQILHELGFLTQGHLVETSRADLVGQYIGETPQKVRAVIEKAAGGVLFIDEAYALVSEDPYKAGWDFGSEAIAELIQQMENRRENLVVIFAGYTHQMKAFIKCNPGLKSRIAGTVEFPNYSVPEMIRIFEKFAADAQYAVEPGALDPLAAYLRRLDQESIRRMGNARGIRNIFEDSLMRQARRIVREGKTSRKALTTLKAVDMHLPDDPGKGILTVIEGRK
jgi:AAA+ superfamily predicted ATPase